MIQGFRSGPPPARTGAPGEQTCFAIGCHQTASGALIENSNQIEVQFPDGMEYAPGMTQRLQVVNRDPQAEVVGFQLSARDSEQGQAGTLTPIDGATQVVSQGGIDYIEHTAPRADAMFEFDWTPPDQDVGNITLWLAMNAANNNFNPSGDRIHLQNFTVQPTAAPDRPAIADNGVVHGATFTTDQGYAPNTFGTIFAANAANATTDWSDGFVNGQAPTELGGVRVLVNGNPAPISFTGRAGDLGADQDQINFIFPDDEARGDVNVVIETEDGSSDPAVVQLSERAPAFFPFEPQGRRFLAAVQNDGSAFVGPADLFGGEPLGRPIEPAQPGDIIQLFGTGFGPTDPAVPAGRIPDIAAPTTEPVTVRFGETPANVLFAGLSPFAGLYQIVVEVPDVADGDHEVIAEIAGRQTQAGAFIQVQQGQ